MNITVLIRNVVDCRVPLPADVYGEQPVPEGMMRIINPADWFALEQSFNLPLEKDSKKVTVVALDDEDAEESLRWCLAAGAQEVIRIWDEAMVDADTIGRGKAAAAAITATKPDLVLCGEGCLDQLDTLLPGVVAASAGIAYVPGVTKVEKVVNGHAVVIRRLEKGRRERVAVSLPALIAVEDGGVAPSYYPDLLGVISAFSNPVPCKDLVSLGLSAERVGSRGAQVNKLLTRTAKPVTTKPRTPDPQQLAEHRLRSILSGGITRKQGEVVTGSPEQLANRIIQFLRSELWQG